LKGYIVESYFDKNVNERAREHDGMDSGILAESALAARRKVLQDAQNQMEQQRAQMTQKVALSAFMKLVGGAASGLGPLSAKPKEAEANDDVNGDNTGNSSDSEEHWGGGRAAAASPAAGREGAKARKRAHTHTATHTPTLTRT